MCAMAADEAGLPCFATGRVISREGSCADMANEHAESKKPLSLLTESSLTTARGSM